MKVHFKNGWFGPEGNRYRKGYTYDVPEKYRELLNPKSVNILEDAPPKPVDPFPPKGSKENKAAA